MFFSLQVDRGNLIQALAGTLLADLKLTTNGLHSPVIIHSRLILKCRLQPWEHSLPYFLSSGRVTLSANLQKARAGSLDPNTDSSLVNRGNVSSCSHRKRKLSCDSIAARNTRGSTSYHKAPLTRVLTTSRAGSFLILCFGFRISTQVENCPLDLVSFGLH